MATAPAPTATAPVAPKEPTAEEKKKAEALHQLEADRAKFEADSNAEIARWTPELHAQAKALADKTYPNGHAAITAAAASKTRLPGNADRDKYRHPVATLDFLGFKPTMTVLEFDPGEGWYTELLAPALAKQGKLLDTTSDPNGPADQRSTLNGQRFKAFLNKAPELYGKVETVVVDGKNPSLNLDGKADMVLVMRALHGMENNGNLDAWLGEFYKALKPGGILGIEQHRAPDDANAPNAATATAKQGYLRQKWVIEKIEAAGFKLAGKSEVNANPKDTKNYEEGVWTLPPTYRLKDKDHDKYAAIGESDRMTLKFVKVAKPAAGAPAKADAAPKK